MSSLLSRQTCLRISLSSKSFDSQSLASENGVILILSSLISWSSAGAGALNAEDDEAIEGGGELLPALIGVLSLGIEDGPEETTPYEK